LLNKTFLFDHFPKKREVSNLPNSRARKKGATQEILLQLFNLKQKSLRKKKKKEIPTILRAFFLPKKHT